MGSPGRSRVVADPKNLKADGFAFVRQNRLLVDGGGAPFQGALDQGFTQLYSATTILAAGGTLLILVITTEPVYFRANLSVGEGAQNRLTYSLAEGGTLGFPGSIQTVRNKNRIVGDAVVSVVVTLNPTFNVAPVTFATGQVQSGDGGNPVFRSDDYVLLKGNENYAVTIQNLDLMNQVGFSLALEFVNQA